MDLMELFFKTTSPTIFKNHIINQPKIIQPNQTLTLVSSKNIGKLNRFFIQLIDKNIPVNISIDNKSYNYTPLELLSLGKIVYMPSEPFLRVYDDEIEPNNFIIEFLDLHGCSYFLSNFSISITNTTDKPIYLKNYEINYSTVHNSLKDKIFNLFNGGYYG